MTAATGAWAQSATWTLTAYGDLQTGDLVVIVDKTSERAMSNDNGTSNPPSAVEVTLSSDKNSLSDAPADNLKWVVERDGDNYKFRKAGSDAHYLYNINSNNGVRVGTNNANQYVFENGGENDVPFMKNTSNSRYIGVYDNSNWRCYTSINNNIKNTVTAFYTKQAASSPAPAGYTVTMKDGVKDADKWTVKVGEGQAQALPIGGLTGDGSETVTLQYNGRLKVKGVKATSEAGAPAAGKTVDLSTLTADYEAKDGETLTGTLANNVKVSIADGATVTLKDVNITNLGENCDWAGINCPGNATLVLEGTNTVCAGRDGSDYNNYPGIYIAPDKTLTIQGDGTLTAYSNGTNPYGGGIGGGYEIACGNIVINGGNITATGGESSAGIGGGYEIACGTITINGGNITATGGSCAAGIGGGDYASCGNITISGGTVSATGGDCSAGIGGGRSNGACGTITIKSTVTSVTATKGSGAPNSIGSGGENGTAITVNIEAGANVTQN